MVTRDQYIRTILLAAAGCPYLWAHYGPEGFDCSGVVTIGMEWPEKKSAQQIYDLYKANKIERLQAPPGSLYFYGNGITRITHVMTVLRHWPDTSGGITLIGARGGDSTTTSTENAKNAKAFVDICFGDYWLDKFVAAVDPFAGQP